MKKLLSTICLFVLGLTISNLSARTAGWGLTGGMNVSKINWKDMKETKPEAEKGWYAGITGMFSIPLSGFGFDGAIIYSQEGIGTGIDNVDAEVAQYLSIPVHLRYDFYIQATEDVLVPFLTIGPQFNYALNEIKFEDFEGHSLGYIVKKANTWRLDMGAGVLLMDHLQLSYSYGIPLGEAIQVDEEKGTTSFNYKLGTHRVGLVYYF